MPETATPNLDNPTFRALFVESLEPEHVPFEVGDGLKCWIDLLPMGDADMDRYQLLGIDYAADSESGKVTLKGVDLESRKKFLISRTVIAWEVWERLPKKGGGLSDWQMHKLPESESARISVLEKRKYTGEFAPWLVAQCERVNGLDGGTEGNSG